MASLQGVGARVTRRLALAGLLAAPAVARAAEPTLAITAYDGFVPPVLRQRFERETGIRIRIRPVASQAPELTLLAAERDRPITDLCTVAGSRLHQFTQAGVIGPLDTARLRHWDRIDPRYADADWNRVGGQVAGLPLLLGANVLVYDTRAVDPAPESWGALFDRRYQGRVTYGIEDCLLCTMLLQGADPTFVAYLENPAAAAAAVAAARDRLIAEKGQVVRFFEDGGELQQLLTGGDAVLAQTYASTPARLILAGLPYRRAVPREGSMAFIYNFAVVKGAPNPDAAYRFLDMLLEVPGIEAVLTRSSGYATAFRTPGAGLSEIELAAYGLPEGSAERLRFSRYEGQALSSALIDRAVQAVRAG